MGQQRKHYDCQFKLSVSKLIIDVRMPVREFSEEFNIAI